MRLLAETTLDRANAAEKQSARVQRRALQYVMEKAGATWKPSKNGNSQAELAWVKEQGGIFMSQLDSVVHNKYDACDVKKLLELLRNQVEYLELCIDVNKMGEGNIPPPPKVVGHIDLDKA